MSLDFDALLREVTDDEFDRACDLSDEQTTVRAQMLGCCDGSAGYAHSDLLLCGECQAYRAGLETGLRVAMVAARLGISLMPEAVTK